MKKIIFLLPFLLFSCMTAIPKIDLDLSLLSDDEKQIISTGIFNYPYDKVFQSCIDILEEEGWSVVELRKADGIIRTDKKSDIFEDKLPITCRVIERDKNKVQVKWFVTIILSAFNSETREMGIEPQKKWNYKLLKKLKQQSIQ